MKLTKRVGAALTASALAFGLLAAPLDKYPFAAGSVVSAAEQAEKRTAAEYVFGKTSALPDSSELEKLYIERLFYGESVSFYKDYGENHLEGASLELYTLLRNEIEAIADGDKTTTSFTVSMTQSFDSASDLEQGFNAAVDALQVDLPHAFYWYDKTIGCVRWTGSGNKITKVLFAVSENYKGGQTETVEFSSGTTKTYNVSVDSSKMTAAKTAVAKAAEIVSGCSDMSDYEKILAYANKICDLTDYNNDAAGNPNTDYGDPWQLVWVFDGDPDTTVVRGLLKGVPVSLRSGRH